MTSNTKKLLDKALMLPPSERLSVVDSILSSLDTPDPIIDAYWKKEAELRLKDYKAGKTKSVSLQHVLSKYREVRAA